MNDFLLQTKRKQAASFQMKICSFIENRIWIIIFLFYRMICIYPKFSSYVRYDSDIGYITVLIGRRYGRNVILTLCTHHGH